MTINFCCNICKSTYVSKIKFILIYCTAVIRSWKNKSVFTSYYIRKKNDSFMRIRFRRLFLFAARSNLPVRWLMISGDLLDALRKHFSKSNADRKCDTVYKRQRFLSLSHAFFTAENCCYIFILCHSRDMCYSFINTL